MFAGHQDRPTPLSTYRDALADPKNNEHHGCPSSDLSVSGQDANRRRRQSHQQERRNERFFSAEPVTQMTEEETSKRPRKETDAESGKGNQQRHVRVAVGEEELRKDQRGGRAVNEEIVPFDRGAGEGGCGGSHRLPLRSRGIIAHGSTPIFDPLTTSQGSCHLHNPLS